MVRVGNASNKSFGLVCHDSQKTRQIGVLSCAIDNGFSFENIKHDKSKVLPEQAEETLENVSKVVMSLYGSVGVHHKASK